MASRFRHDCGHGGDDDHGHGDGSSMNSFSYFFKILLYTDQAINFTFRFTKSNGFFAGFCYDIIICELPHQTQGTAHAS